jgi:hypothetical protein
MDKKNINELYWLAEELKSYTDLTGDRFDIDNAQRRLFPMQIFISNINSTELQKLYDELSDLLEVAAFFDKNAFSEKVDELYQILETRK